MNLVIDIGNTRAKLAVFDVDKLIYIEVVMHEAFQKAAISLIEKYDCKQGIISSVIFLKKDQTRLISSKISLLELNSEVNTPFINEYGTPKTLGVDRIALMAAAVVEYPDQNVLVIDAGTCITYDFVSSDKIYKGGAISPGVQMRYNAMRQLTSKLPQLSPEDRVNLIGNTTNNAMHSGVLNGVIGEIDWFVRNHKEKNNYLTVVLTGGDANYLANKLKIDIFAQPNFLLLGLNRILIYNNQ